MSYTVLITGATGGLGTEFAKFYARKGYNLILIARNIEILRTLTDKLHSQYPEITVEYFAQDLSQENAADDIFNFVRERKIRVTHLINNAGFGDFGEFLDSQLSKQTSMIHVNIRALMQLSYYFGRDMRSHGYGRIINVCSMAAFEPGPLMSVYYATKAFVLSFSEALSVELRPSSVRVLAICPGPTATGFEKNAHLESSGLFKHLKVARAYDVVRYADKKIEHGRVVTVHGFINKIMIASVRFVPRPIVRYCAYWLQK